MKKVIFFIDGFNLYHSIEDNPTYHKYKWLDLQALCSRFTNKNEQIVNIMYFTALAHWNPGKVARHLNYIRALENVGISIVLGKFKPKTKTCPRCNSAYGTHEEKQTDINIAIHLFKFAIDNEYEKAFLISGDSDLVPAINEVKKRFPAKEIMAIFPINRKSKEIKSACGSGAKMSEFHLSISLFPDPYTLKDGTILYCPSTWK